MTSMAMETIASTINVNSYAEEDEDEDDDTYDDFDLRLDGLGEDDLLTRTEEDEVVTEFDISYVYSLASTSNESMVLTNNTFVTPTKSSPIPSMVVEEVEAPIETKKVDALRRSVRKLSKSDRWKRAQAKAKKATEEMTCAALRKAERAISLKSAATTTSSSSSSSDQQTPPSPGEVGDTMWYLLWSEEHQRDYYYQPATAMSLWREKDYYTTTTKPPSTPRRVTPRQTTTTTTPRHTKDDDIAIDTLFNVERSPLDEFFLPSENIGRSSSSSTYHQHNERTKRLIRNIRRVNQKHGWIATIVLLAFCVANQLQEHDSPSYEEPKAVPPQDIKTPTKRDEQYQPKDSPTPSTTQLWRQQRQPQHHLDTIEWNNNPGPQPKGADVNSWPKSPTTSSSTPPLTFESTEEIGVHSSMEDLMKEVHMEPRVKEILMDFFSSGSGTTKDDHDRKPAMNANVNTTATRRVVDPKDYRRRPDWCKLPLLGKLPDCHPNRRIVLEAPQRHSSIMDDIMENLLN